MKTIRGKFSLVNIALVIVGIFIITSLLLVGCKSSKKKSSKTDPSNTPPTVVVLKTPLMAVSFNRTPTLTVSGVQAGDTVRLFNSSECAEEDLVASAIVEDGKTSVDLTTETLSADPANYHFYANRTNSAGASACSSASASYQIVACVNEYYLPIEGNAELGTDAFCVMQTEAKGKDDVNGPWPCYCEHPWRNITPDDAKAACRNKHNITNGSCDLLSNRQWMAIARDIEATAANWSGGEVGVGKINRGYSDKHGSWIPLRIDDPEDHWFGVNSSDWSQKRTHVLSNGSIIWDFAGNAYEWVDWETGGETLTLGPNTCSPEQVDLYTVDCADLDPNDYLPGNPANIDPANYTMANYGIGGFYGTTEEARVSGGGGAAMRGGYYKTGENAGIFRLYLGYSRDYTGDDVSFRCACTVYPAE